MDLHIRRMADGDLEPIVQLSLLAWEPVFRSFEQVLGPAIYALLFPDWRTSQRKVVETFCNDHGRITVWVADVAGVVAGFVAYELKTSENVGEVHLLAVHPDYQNRGIGTALNTFALTKLQEGGMQLAVVGTGGDPGHAAARRSYEKAGYTPFVTVQYYKAL